MDDERTILDNEKTEYMEMPPRASKHDKEATLRDDEWETEDQEQAPGKNKKGRKKSGRKGVVAGMGSGIVLGAAAALFPYNTVMPHTEDQLVDQSEGPTEDTHPEWTDGQVSVATAPNDGMSFAQAFAAARAEVGPGGVFEWRGYIYSTYTEDEWNAMTAQEQEEYGSHLNWQGDTVDVVDATPGRDASPADITDTAHVNNTAHVTDTADVNDTVEVVDTADAHDTVEVIDVESPIGDEQTIDVLGVEPDDGVTVDNGGLLIDGEPVEILGENDIVPTTSDDELNGDAQDLWGDMDVVSMVDGATPTADDSGMDFIADADVL